jgi:hypothetical protein
MVRQWFDKTRLALARYRVERLNLAFPKFRSTLLLLWVISIIGLLYGHVLVPAPQPQTVSVTLTAIGFLGAVFILALENPIERLKLLLLQIVAILLFLAFGVVSYFTYVLLFQTQTAVLGSIKITWITGSVVVALLTWRTIRHLFARLRETNDKSYPGMISAPILFVIVVANYIWWWLG